MPSKCSNLFLWKLSQKSVIRDCPCFPFALVLRCPHWAVRLCTVQGLASFTHTPQWSRNVPLIYQSVPVKMSARIRTLTVETMSWARYYTNLSHEKLLSLLYLPDLVFTHQLPYSRIWNWFLKVCFKVRNNFKPWSVNYYGTKVRF